MGAARSIIFLGSSKLVGSGTQLKTNHAATRETGGPGGIRAEGQVKGELGRGELWLLGGSLLTYQPCEGAGTVY